MITASQSRAARALLSWSQDHLASHANVSTSTVRDFEKGRRTPTPNNLLGIRYALEKAGIEFIDQDDATGPGVRLSKPEAVQQALDLDEN